MVMVCGLTSAEWFNLIVPYVDDLDSLVMLSRLTRKLYRSPRIQQQIEAWKKDRFKMFPVHYRNRLHRRGRPMKSYDWEQKHPNLYGCSQWKYHGETRAYQMAIFSSPLQMVRHFCDFINTRALSLHNKMYGPNVSIELSSNGIFLRPSRWKSRYYHGLTIKMLNNCLPFVDVNNQAQHLIKSLTSWSD